MTRAPTDRAHLSIGEVLSLLQRDFPDVTISKIRFLESQGLLDPERTPSGYRKFYDGDIDRLRWILQQQKENYLPLRVIRDRLDGAGSPPTKPAPASGPESGSHEPEPEYEDESEYAFAGVASAGSERTRHGHAHVVSSGSIVAATRTEHTDVSGAGDEKASPDAGSASTSAAATPGTVSTSGAPDRPADSANGGGRGDPATPETTGPVSAAPSPARSEQASPPDERTESSAHLGSGAASLSFTLDELAEAAGLSTRDLRDLERFGLLESFNVGDATYYDGEGLVIARTAAAFLRHGIEARHIRSYKVAVDREAGLFEQIVLPLLKQRNPDARRLATDTVSELVRLGETMRGALLRRELREHMPPG